MTDLNRADRGSYDGRVPPLDSAMAINDNGQIVATAVVRSTREHAVPCY